MLSTSKKTKRADSTKRLGMPNTRVSLRMEEGLRIELWAVVVRSTLVGCPDPVRRQMYVGGCARSNISVCLQGLTPASLGLHAHPCAPNKHSCGTNATRLNVVSLHSRQPKYLNRLWCVDAIPVLTGEETLPQFTKAALKTPRRGGIN